MSKNKMKIVRIFFFIVLLILPLYVNAQNWNFITSSGEYYWGESMAETEELTDMEALISLYGMDSQDSIDDKQAISDKKTSDTDNKQAINNDKASDTNDKQAIKASDKISSLKGISSKTRDNLKKIMEYMRTNPSVGNSEISELLGLSSDRTRLLLITLVNEGLLSMSGNNKERVYSLL